MLKHETVKVCFTQYLCDASIHSIHSVILWGPLSKSVSGLLTALMAVAWGISDTDEAELSVKI